MIRARTSIGFAALFSGALFGQSATTAPASVAFDAAEIRSSAHVTNPYMRSGMRNGRYEIKTASMLELISYANDVEGEKVQGGPAWLEIDQFDIIAKVPPNTPQAVVKTMLQNLLVDRFGLKIHKDTKPMPGYALTAPKGKGKLKESEDGAASECHGQPQNPPPTVPMNSVVCHARSVDQIAQDMRNFGGVYFTGPVVNQTGVAGAFDYTIHWTPRPAMSLAGADGVTIFDAVDKQLGLKLEPGKIPVPVLVVDSVNEKWTPNAEDLTKAFPPLPPAEFEVAVVKPSNPDGGNAMGRVQNGRVDAQNIPLKMIVQIAFDDLPDERVAGAPKFLETVKYDIAAKAPPAPRGFDISDEDLRDMLRNLLADRFKMKWHMEDRPVDGYVLTSVKPRMSKADPSNRTGCHEGPGADGKDPRITNPVLGRLMTCQNMTMAQFTGQLPNLANGYARVDVLDQTGLTDAYDFTVSFSTVGQVRGGPGQNPPNPGTAASDPNGALSLPDAINKQLGLKLELKKRPMQVLVIDHIEEKPTEN